MNEEERFIQLISASDTLKARWDSTVDEIQTAAQELHGEKLTAQDIVRMFSARVAVLSGQPEDHLPALAEVPKIAAKIRAAKIAAGDTTVQAQSLAEIQMMPNTSGYDGARRMTRARELGLDKAPQRDVSGLTPTQKMHLLLTMSPHQRMHYARQWGVGV